MGKIAKKDKNANKIAPNEAWDAEIKQQRRLFVLFYCTDEECFFNGTRAYRKAYPKCKSDSTAASSASKLLRTDKVISAIRKLLKLSREIDDELTSYRILKTFETLAFYNPADIITNTGVLVKPLNEMGNLAMCVEQINTTYTKDGAECTTVKLVDRYKALGMLMRYLSLVRPAEEKNIDMPVVMITEKDANFSIEK